jgi:uncharacterized protein (DUF39 family)
MLDRQRVEQERKQAFTQAVTTLIKDREVTAQLLHTLASGQELDVDAESQISDIHKVSLKCDIDTQKKNMFTFVVTDKRYTKRTCTIARQFETGK